MKYVIGLVAVLALGCTKRQDAVDVIPYYDLSSQLRKHIKILYAEDAYVIKYVVYNGKPDQVINRKPDWNKEFDVFFEADVHVPSLVGLYSVDTTLAADSTLNITYKATTEDETLRELTINTNHQGDLLRFDALMQSGSMLNKTTRKLSYNRFRSFKIQVDQANKYSADDSYSVKGEVHLEDQYFE
jgi:hypothetical protein